ncbi:hypothetical protein AAMO2058_001023200 [Amorphochlora amoebiformis]
MRRASWFFLLFPIIMRLGAVVHMPEWKGVGGGHKTLKRHRHRHSQANVNTTTTLHKHVDCSARKNKRDSKATYNSEPYCSDKGNRKKIAIIGAGGFIGSSTFSYLTKSLPTEKFNLLGYDRDHRAKQVSPDIIHQESSSIDVSSFHAFIFLGGLTSNRDCELHSKDRVFKENVKDPLQIAKKMNKRQLFLFTSSVDDKKDSHTPLSRSRYNRVKILREFSEKHPKKSPKIVHLRLGHVVGTSAGQRVDGLVSSLLRSSFATGIMQVRNPGERIEFVGLGDLNRAMESILHNSDKIEGFLELNLVSFSAQIGAIANEIAMRTGSTVDALDSPDKIQGKAVTGEKEVTGVDFEKRFQFQFLANRSNLVEKMVSCVPTCLSPQGVHVPPPLMTKKAEKINSRNSSKISERSDTQDYESIVCPICGSPHIRPLFDFKKSESEKIHVVKCSACHHIHLPKPISSKQHVKRQGYESKEFMTWISNKIISELPSTSTLFQIYPKSASQLSLFPSNWHKIALLEKRLTTSHNLFKNHHNLFESSPCLGNVHNSSSNSKNSGKFFERSSNSKFPGEFSESSADSKALIGALKDLGVKVRVGDIEEVECSSENSKKFLEELDLDGGLDAILVKNVLGAAKLASLQIIGFERGGVDNVSCIVTLSKGGESQREITEMVTEIEEGIEDRFYNFKFAQRSIYSRDWLNTQLRGLARSGYKIGGYGTNTEAQSLITFLGSAQTNIGWSLSFALTPHTSSVSSMYAISDVPIKPLSYLPIAASPKSSSPLALFLLEWSDWSRIKSEVLSKHLALNTTYTMIVVVPFPSPKIMRLTIKNTDNKESELEEVVLVEMPYFPPPFNRPLWKKDRREILLVSHFYNEEFLMPYFIRHHASMFDRAILIDYRSTDNTLEIIRSQAPSTWTVVKSKSSEFDAAECDIEVQDQEQTRIQDWKIALTTTEFLIFPNFRREVGNFPIPEDGRYATRFPAVVLLGDDKEALSKYRSLPEQRSVWNGGIKFIQTDVRTNEYRRIIHTGISGRYYSIGRHLLQADPVPAGGDYWEGYSGLIMKFSWTPWPQVRIRKSQIGSKIPDSDKQQGRGFQHIDNMDLTKLNKSKAENYTPDPSTSTDLKDANADNEGISEPLRLIFRTYQEAIRPHEVRFSKPQARSPDPNPSHHTPHTPHIHSKKHPKASSSSSSSPRPWKFSRPPPQLKHYFQTTDVATKVA